MGGGWRATPSGEGHGRTGSLLRPLSGSARSPDRGQGPQLCPFLGCCPGRQREERCRPPHRPQNRPGHALGRTGRARRERRDRWGPGEAAGAGARARGQDKCWIDRVTPRSLRHSGCRGPSCSVALMVNERSVVFTVNKTKNSEYEKIRPRHSLARSKGCAHSLVIETFGNRLPLWPSG